MSQPKLVSLAEMSRATGGMLYRADGKNFDSGASPTPQELAECLFFSPGDGRIWLHDQRVLLLHGSSLGSLRRDLIDTLGRDKARGFLTRAGYVSGARDAQLVRERWSDSEPLAIFTAGTKLHALEGLVKVEPLKVEFDVNNGYYDGEFIWHHSIEDDQHIASYGVGTESACWMEVGYAMGYVSGLCDRLVVFREVDCRAMGSATCRVIGKAADMWDNVEEDVFFLNSSELANAAGFGIRSRSNVADLPEPPDEADEKQLIGASSAFNSACHSLKRVAPTEATVLFSGESGVGKEMFAYMLHRISPRQAGPFIALNCAAIPDNLLESELFGVDRGAYTGATESRPGRFERAAKGTLFLDEISSLSLTAQGKLLRALQEREVERVGGVRVIKVDVRVAAACNVDLRAEVRAGRFREDLFFRLNVFPIRLPPLRERRDDIPLLSHFFFKRYCRKHGRRIGGISMKAMRVLLNYDFPGNIRELQNLIERGVIAADEDGLIEVCHMFHSEDMPDELMYLVSASGLLSTAASAARPTETANGHGTAGSIFEQVSSMLGSGEQVIGIDLLEARLIHEAVERADGNLSLAARSLKLTRAQLAYRLKRLKNAPEVTLAEK